MTTAQQANLNAFVARIGSNTLTSADKSLLQAALNSIIPQWGFAGTGFGADARGSVLGNQDEQNAREWFACLWAEAEGLTSGGGGGGPVVPASWLVPAWFIDPVNGSDSNSGQSSGAPLKTWAQLINLWGTVSPTLAQNTVITFLSTQPDNTDPIVFRPTVTGGSVVSIQGTAPTVITAGVVLATTTAKNRATGTLLSSNLGATAAAGLLVQNTTSGKSSRAWVYTNVAGNVWRLTQPLSPTAVPQATVPTEVDTWANGDTVNLLRPVGLNVVEINPILADYNASADNGVVLYQVQITNPTALLQAAYIGANVQLQEVTSLKVLVGKGSGALASTGIQNLLNVLSNVGIAGGWYGGAWLFVGGALVQTTTSAIHGSTILLDGDLIVGGGAGVELDCNNSAEVNLGLVMLDGQTLDVLGPEIQVAPGVYGSTAIWGSGGIRVDGFTNLRYNGSGTAVATFLQSGAWHLNSDTTANSVIVGSPNVYNGGITITAAHLDAAAGAAGFGGAAARFGGGSITAT